MWQPITQREFESLYRRQEESLSARERTVLRQFRTPLTKVRIRRSELYGDEEVFVVARCERGVLYFDDVEYGFNISTIDENGVIVHTGGSQFSLGEAVRCWLMQRAEKAWDNCTCTDSRDNMRER